MSATNYYRDISPLLAESDGELYLKNAPQMSKGKVMYFDENGKLKASDKGIENVSNATASNQEMDAVLYALIF